MANTRDNHGIHARWMAFFSTPARNRVLRYALFFLGVYGIAFSIALARTAQLGTSPISAIPNVLSYTFPDITIGTFQILFNLLMVLGQIVLNRSFHRPVELFQMVMTIFLGAFVDLNVMLLHGLPVPNYAAAWAWVGVSIFTLALAVSLELMADVIILPGEGIVISIANVSGKPFPRCKVAYDVSCIVVAAGLALAALGSLTGVREGTVATAILTGPLVKLTNRITAPLKAWIPEKPR